MQAGIWNSLILLDSGSRFDRLSVPLQPTGSASRFNRQAQRPSFVRLWGGRGGFCLLISMQCRVNRVFYSWGLIMTLIESKPSDTSLKPFTISVKGSRCVIKSSTTTLRDSIRFIADAISGGPQ